MHSYARHDGLVGLVICDGEYPQRVAFTLIGKMLEDFTAMHGMNWMSVTTDNSLDFPPINDAIVRYQDPREADQLTKLQSDLDEVKDVVLDTMDSLLQRGERLDTLVDKSDDLSRQSKVFYKQSKKANGCCVVQ